MRKHCFTGFYGISQWYYIRKGHLHHCNLIISNQLYPQFSKRFLKRIMHLINIIYTLLINFETTSYFVWNQKCYKCHVTFLEAYEGSMRNIFWCIKVCIPIWQNTKFKTHAPVSILIRFKDQKLQWVVLILNILLKQNLHMEPQQVKRQRFVLLTNFIGKYIFNIMILYWHFCL